MNPHNVEAKIVSFRSPHDPGIKGVGVSASDSTLKYEDDVMSCSLPKSQDVQGCRGV